MAEINLNDIDDSDGVIGITVQYGNHEPIPDSNYDVLQMGNEVTIMLEDAAQTCVIVAVIDSLLGATNTATEALKLLRNKVIR